MSTDTFAPTHRIHFAHGDELVEVINEVVDDGSKGAYSAAEHAAEPADWPAIRVMPDGRWLHWENGAGEPHDITHLVEPVLVAAPYANGDVVIEPGDTVRVIRAWGGLGPVGTFDGWGTGAHESDDTLVVSGEWLAPGDRIEPAAPDAG